MDWLARRYLILALLIPAAVVAGPFAMADDDGNEDPLSCLAAAEPLWDDADGGTEAEGALRLGCKVLAVSRAIQDPAAPGAMRAVTDLGHDQRYYVMVRGWLWYQLQGDMSLLEANKEKTPERIKARISFLKRAIQAIDLE